MSERPLSRYERRLRDSKSADGLFELMYAGPGLELLISEHRPAASTKQRDLLIAVALSIEEGRPLTDAERSMAAETLRAAAELRPPTLKRRPGRKPTLHKENVRMAYDLLTCLNRMSKNRARDLLAARCGVSVEAIRITVASSDGTKDPDKFRQALAQKL